MRLTKRREAGYELRVTATSGGAWWPRAEVGSTVQKYEWVGGVGRDEVVAPVRGVVVAQRSPGALVPRGGWLMTVLTTDPRHAPRPQDREPRPQHRVAPAQHREPPARDIVVAWVEEDERRNLTWKVASPQRDAIDALIARVASASGVEQVGVVQRAILAALIAEGEHKLVERVRVYLDAAPEALRA